MALDRSHLGYRVASAAARRLPASAVRPVSRAVGVVGARAMRGRADMVARHQRRVRPDLTEGEVRAAVTATFASYAHYWLESFRLPGTSPDALAARFSVSGYEHVEAGLAEGRGVILALPHLGGWEWAGFWLTAVQHLPVSVVVEQLESSELFEWFVALREAFGMNIIPLDSSAGTRCTKALADNHVLCLLCDRDLSGTGIEVDFLGERTTLPGGPATIAVRSGAPLLPTAVYFDGDSHHGIVRPPVDTSRQGRLREDVTRITQDLADDLAGLIRVDPQQWHLLQPNWPSDRAPEATR